jgi:hypothetical protein
MVDLVSQTLRGGLETQGRSEQRVVHVVVTPSRLTQREIRHGSVRSLEPRLRIQISGVHGS